MIWSTRSSCNAKHEVCEFSIPFTISNSYNTNDEMRWTCVVSVSGQAVSTLQVWGQGYHALVGVTICMRVKDKLRSANEGIPCEHVKSESKLKNQNQNHSVFERLAPHTHWCWRLCLSAGFGVRGLWGCAFWCTDGLMAQHILHSRLNNDILYPWRDWKMTHQ